MVFRKMFLIISVIMFLIGNTINVQAAPLHPNLFKFPLKIAPALHADISVPLRSLPKMIPNLSKTNKMGSSVFLTRPDTFNFLSINQVPKISPIRNSPQINATSGLNFAGIGDGDYGFSPNSMPPDTEGVVGATQYVQWVNTSFAVFDKASGAILDGFPKDGNSVWAGFGGGCETNNDGDPIVQYDKGASLKLQRLTQQVAKNDS